MIEEETKLVALSALITEAAAAMVFRKSLYFKQLQSLFPGSPREHRNIEAEPSQYDHLGGFLK